MLQRAEDGVAAPKAHFGLGGMRVDVHVGVVKRYVDNGDWKAALFEKAVIRLLQRVAEHAALHPAAVDEEVHIAAISPVRVGAADHAVNADRCGGIAAVVARVDGIAGNIGRVGVGGGDF